MAKKNLDLNEYDVSEVVEAKGAKVQGIMTKLFPMKVGKKSNRRYFEGQLTDAASSVRGVIFTAAAGCFGQAIF